MSSVDPTVKDAGGDATNGQSSFGMGAAIPINGVRSRSFVDPTVEGAGGDATIEEGSRSFGLGAAVSIIGARSIELAELVRAVFGSRLSLALYVALIGLQRGRKKPAEG